MISFTHKPMKCSVTSKQVHIHKQRPFEKKTTGVPKFQTFGTQQWQYQRNLIKRKKPILYHTKIGSSWEHGYRTCKLTHLLVLVYESRCKGCVNSKSNSYLARLAED